jgi:hypothetical protein
MITYTTTPRFRNVNKLLIVDDSFAPNASATVIRIININLNHKIQYICKELLI